MSDPNALVFPIRARDETAATLRKMEENANQAQARFSRAATTAKTKVTGQARQAREAFGRWAEPARALSPQLERAHSTLQRMGKASKAVQSVFATTRTKAAAAAKEQTGALAKMRQEAERGAHRAANIAADRIAGRHGLGRFTGTDDIRAVGERFFGEERRGAEPTTLARAQRDEAHAYESAFQGHMADAERGIADVAKGMEGAGVAAEGAEAGVGALVGTIGGLALAAVAAGVAVEVMAAKVSSKFARTGQGLANASMETGLDATTLQRWRGAAERSGVDPNAAQGALAGLGLKLHDLSYGMGDAGTANTLAQLGIATPKPGETPDVDASAKTIIDKLQAIRDPYTKLNMARSLGVEALLPMTRGGSAGVSADQAAVDKTGSVYTRDDLEKADAQARRLTDFDQSRRGFDKRVGSLATDISAPGLGAASAAVRSADLSKVGELLRGTAGGASGGLKAVEGAAQGAAKALGDFIAPAAHAAEPGAVRYGRDVALTRVSTAPGPPYVRPPLHGGVQATISKGAYAALNPAILQNILEASQRFGVDPSIMIQEGFRESSFNPRAGAGSSSAKGLYQFTKATWLQVLAEHGQQAGYAEAASKVHLDQRSGQYYVDSRERKAVEDLRFDPRASAMLGAAYMKDNQDLLRNRLGRAPTGADTYAAHFFGPTQAARFLRQEQATPKADAGAAFPAAAASNPGVFAPKGHEKSLEEVLQGFAASMKGEIVIRVEADGRVSKVVANGAPALNMKVASTR